MKSLFVVFLFLLLLAGCATSTVETRKQERSSDYAGLSPEVRAQVDQGRIQLGMSMDAVYIAWGKPAQILESQSPAGTIVTWLYQATHFQEYRYWAYRPTANRDGFYSQPYLAYDYQPHQYVEAEVRFENGAVKDWQTLPRPTY